MRAVPLRIAAMNAACLCVGATVGFFLGAAVRDAAPAGRAPKEPAVALPTPAAPSPAAAADDKVPRDPLTALIDAVALDAVDVPRGDGVLSGRVFTRSGEPVGGARIEALPTGAPPAPPSAATGLTADVESFLWQRRWREAALRRGASAADGSFAVTGLVDRLHIVDAFAEGYRIEAVRAQPGDALELVAEAVVRVTVEVVLPQGRPPPRARIDIVRTSGNPGGGARNHTSAEWTPASPEITVAAGVAELTARCTVEENEFHSPEPTRVTLVPGEAPSPVTLALVIRLAVRGRVFFPEGDAGGQADVHLQRVPANGEAAGTVGRDPFHRVENVHVASPRELGRFDFNDLEPGTYALGLARGDHEVREWETVEVVDRSVTRDLTVPPLDASEYVVVRVVGPDGDLLPEVSISMHRQTPSSSSSGPAARVEQLDGSIRVLHPPEEANDGTAGARYFISVHSGRHGEQTIEYRPGETRELRFEFAPPAFLEITVTGYSTVAHRDFEVRLSPAAATEGRSRGTEQNLDAQGRGAFGPLAPGEYDVVLCRDRRAGFEATRQRVTLRSGENRVALAMPLLHTLRLRVDRDTGVERLTVRTSDGSERWSGIVHENGWAEVRGLPAGEYTVTPDRGAEHGLMVVRVDGDTSVDYTAAPANALRVAIHDPEGYFARAGLQSGDRIVAIDGTAIANAPHAHALLAATLGSPETRLEVLRDGQRFELAIESRRLRQDGGASFVPFRR